MRTKKKKVKKKFKIIVLVVAILSTFSVCFLVGRNYYLKNQKLNAEKRNTELINNGYCGRDN